MADVNKAKFEVEIGPEGELKLRKLTGAIDEFGIKGEQAAGKFTTAFQTMIGFVGGAAVVGAFKSVTNAAFGLFDAILTDGIKAAREQEDAINELNTALVLSGIYSAEASKGIQDYASELQKSTKFADEAIVSASALIQNLGHLSEDGLKKATSAALDLSSALGKDLNSAALIVGKVAAGELGGLSRLGINLKETGDRALDSARGLEALSQKFGGAAQAQVNTYSGAVARLTNAYGENLEQVGNAVVKNQSLINVINVATEMFFKLSSGLEKNQGSFQKLVSDGIVLFVEGVRVAVAGVQTAAITFLKLEAASFALSYGISEVTDALTFGLTDAGTRAQESAVKFGEIETQIKKLEEGQGPLGALSDGLYKLQAAAEAGLGKTAENAERTTNGLKSAKVAQEEFTKTQLALAEEGKKLAEATIQKADPAEEYAAKNEALTAAFAQEKITREAYVESLILIEEDKNLKLSAMETAKADFLIAENQRLTQENLFGNETQIQANQDKLQRILAAENLSAKDRTKIQQAYSNQSKIIEQQRGQAVGDSLTQLASLQNAKTKEMAIVGKAAAIAQATIETYSGATKAASALAGIPIVGPALAVAAAAAFIAGGLFRVAQIAGVPLATGITEVPAGYSNDTFAARLSSGERVVDRGTNQDLKSFLSDGGTMNRTLLAILARLNALETRTVVNIGNRTIVDEVREGIRSGRSIDV